MFIVMVGNVIDGYSIYGTWKHHEDALHYAEMELDAGWAWIIVPITAVASRGSSITTQ